VTGYGDIATAVTAKKWARWIISQKPADADDVVAALLASGCEKSSCRQADVGGRVRWEHIQRIYEDVQPQRLETARRLNITAAFAAHSRQARAAADFCEDRA
jgi:two-component system response regulator RegA